MYKKSVTCVVIASIGFAMLIAGGCESESQNSALLGAAIGAGIGSLVGDSEGALIGAAVGGGAGYMMGNESEKKNVSVWITNSNGSMTEVKLRRQGPGFMGTKNDYYPSMPTKEQLTQLYGQ
jgi:hypothetical protein